MGRWHRVFWATVTLCAGCASLPPAPTVPADDPAFARSFRLHGGHEVAARLFGPEVRSHLLQLTDRPVRISGGGEALVLSHRPLTPPAELPTLLAKSTELLELLSSAQARP